MINNKNWAAMLESENIRIEDGHVYTYDSTQHAHMHAGTRLSLSDNDALELLCI